MEQIWAPWRIEYIMMEKPDECILCTKPNEDNDKANYILSRGEKNFIMLNRWPYNPGHLMIVPYRHISSPEELTDEEMMEHFDLVRRSIRALKNLLDPNGFNIGINMGRVAGAGIEDHVHTHVVPRWNGDTNFMPVLANTKVLPESLTSLYDKLLLNL
jgi:ATP adenylyltransferase